MLAVASRREMLVTQLMQLAAMLEYPVLLKWTPSVAQTSRSKVILVPVLLVEAHVVVVQRSATLVLGKLTIDLMRQFLRTDSSERSFSG